MKISKIAFTLAFASTSLLAFAQETVSTAASATAANTEISTAPTAPNLQKQIQKLVRVRKRLPEKLFQYITAVGYLTPMRQNNVVRRSIVRSAEVHLFFRLELEK